MGFASLGSGSKGNGTVIALNSTGNQEPQLFLVDCGFSLKQTERRLGRLGLSPGDITAIFVTHEHSDHVGGIAALAHKYRLPIYASYGTAKSALTGAKVNTFDGDVPFTLAGIVINPVRVPHDAREPTQFVFDDGSEKIGVLSDLGHVTSHVVEQFSDCDYLLLEANHDLSMLMQGKYPPRLKQRVGQNLGHLSNHQALSLLKKVAHEQLHVVIGHISGQNNARQILERTFTCVLDQVGSLSYADQDAGFDWLGQRPLLRQLKNRQLAIG